MMGFAMVLGSFTACKIPDILFLVSAKYYLTRHGPSISNLDAILRNDPKDTRLIRTPVYLRRLEVGTLVLPVSWSITSFRGASHDRNGSIVLPRQSFCG